MCLPILLVSEKKVSEELSFKCPKYGDCDEDELTKGGLSLQALFIIPKADQIITTLIQD